MTLLSFWIAATWLGVGAALVIVGHNILRHSDGGSGIGTIEFIIGVLTWPIVLSALVIAWAVERWEGRGGAQ